MQESDTTTPPHLPGLLGGKSTGCGTGQSKGKDALCTVDPPGGLAQPSPQHASLGELQGSLSAREKLSHSLARNTDLLQHQFANST